MRKRFSIHHRYRSFMNELRADRLAASKYNYGKKLNLPICLKSAKIVMKGNFVMVSRIFSALSSAFIVSLVISLLNYTAIADRQEGIYYSFASLLGQGFIVVLVIFLFIAVPVSLIVDQWLVKMRLNSPKPTHYLIMSIVYMIAGAVTLIALVRLMNGSEITRYGSLILAGAFGSYLYLNLMIILNKWITRALKKATMT